MGILEINQILSGLSQGILHVLKTKKYHLFMDYDDDHQSGIVSFIHPNPDEFMNNLLQLGGSATYRNGLIRLSPGIYQTQDTLKKLDPLL